MIREFIPLMVHDMVENNTIEKLLTLRASTAKPVPDSNAIPGFVELLLKILFPHFTREIAKDSREDLSRLIESGRLLLRTLCAPVIENPSKLEKVDEDFITELPTFHTRLREDAEAIFRGDPAAASVDEVIVAYPGFLAIAVYRLAHWFHQRQVRIVPRMMAEYAHRMTGIDIHPGATIGSCFVIDHGTGIVIGETSIIEDNVKIYQGVTLGALSVDKSLADTKRHPTIESNVVIYANATILGGQTVVGAGSTIGGNVWLTTSVPSNSKVYHRSDLSVVSGDTDT